MGKYVVVSTLLAGGLLGGCASAPKPMDIMLRGNVMIARADLERFLADRQTSRYLASQVVRRYCKAEPCEVPLRGRWSSSQEELEQLVRLVLSGDVRGE